MKNFKAKQIIFSVAMVVLLITSILGFGGIGIFNKKSAKYSSWMNNIDDNTSLRDINMPGSHDTMALFSFAGLMGKCQSLDLESQLNLGVRFLDIRLQAVDNDLAAVHGIVDQKKDFWKIALTINRFLTKHPSEFIIMSIKEENPPKNSSKSFEELLLKVLAADNNKDVFSLEKSLPEKIADVRGKAIILSRYPGASVGIPAYHGWEDSTSFTLDNDIFVQDKYKITSKDEKQAEVIKCFNESGHALKINFLSAYRTDTFPPSYSISAAKDINPWIDKEIANYNDRNIVLYDFISEKGMDAFFKGVL